METKQYTIYEVTAPIPGCNCLYASSDCGNLLYLTGQNNTVFEVIDGMIQNSRSCLQALKRLEGELISEWILRDRPVNLEQTLVRGDRVGLIDPESLRAAGFEEGLELFFEKKPPFILGSSGPVELPDLTAYFELYGETLAQERVRAEADAKESLSKSLLGLKSVCENIGASGTADKTLLSTFLGVLGKDTGSKFYDCDTDNPEQFARLFGVLLGEYNERLSDISGVGLQQKVIDQTFGGLFEQAYRK